jgi:hypothetical protein
MAPTQIFQVSVQVLMMPICCSEGLGWLARATEVPPESRAMESRAEKTKLKFMAVLLNAVGLNAFIVFQMSVKYSRSRV